MNFDFPGSEKFTRRHKELESLYEHFSIADLDTILVLAKHLSRDHSSIFDHLESFEHQSPSTIVDAKTEPPKKRELGIPFPTNDGAVQDLKECVMDSAFMTWYLEKKWNYDLDAEWERFALWHQEKQYRFKGKNLRKSARLAFQKWLSTPYKKQEMTPKKRRELLYGKQSEAPKNVKIALKLRAEAIKLSTSISGGRHWMEIWKEKLGYEGILLADVKDWL